MANEMDLRSVITTLVKSIIGTDLLSIRKGIVSAVSEDKKFCTVEFSDGGVGIDDVSINSDDQTNGMKAIPSIGAVVIVAMIDKEDGYLLAVSEASEIILFDGENTVPVSAKVTSQLNKIESDLNNLKTAFASWVVAPSDGGAALKALTATWSGSSLTETTDSNIENEKFKQ